MDCFQGITVEILSNDQALILYNDPNAAEIQDNHLRHYYVEAMIGCTFQVKVNLTPQFILNGAQAVDFRVEIDGNSPRSTWCTKAYLQKAFSQGKSGGYTFSRIQYFCDKTGQWASSDHAFSTLVLGMLDLFIPSGY